MPTAIGGDEFLQEEIERAEKNSDPTREQVSTNFRLSADLLEMIEVFAEIG
jgi:uncharacterized membrane-anchored protein YhcB (DUF1043 family)